MLPSSLVENKKVYFFLRTHTKKTTRKNKGRKYNDEENCWVSVYDMNDECMKMKKNCKINSYEEEENYEKILCFSLVSILWCYTIKVRRYNTIDKREWMLNLMKDK